MISLLSWEKAKREEISFGGQKRTQAREPHAGPISNKSRIALRLPEEVSACHP